MLRKSNVVFNEQQHTYMLDGKQLSGITGLLSKYLFPNKYDSVPPSILEEAKEKGTLIHSQINLMFQGFEPAEKSDEYKAFMAYKGNRNFIQSEYIVSDNSKYASAIDIVDDEYNLYDIKTSYKLDKEYVSWQLSIYAYFFELQNGFPAKDLYAIHLKGDKCKFIKVDKIPKERIIEFFKSIENDKPVKTNEELLAKAQEFSVALKNLKEEYERKENEFEKIKELIADEMEKNNVMKLDNDFISISYKSGYEKRTFDSKKFKEDNPDVYEQYSKTTQVKRSLTIKFK